MIYLLAVVSYGMDWYSTIIQHDYLKEENPIMRSVWSYGDWAFTLVNILSLAGVIFILWIADKVVTHSTLRGVLWASASLLFGFKIILALANLGNVEAYRLTLWVVGY